MIIEGDHFLVSSIDDYIYLYFGHFSVYFDYIFAKNIKYYFWINTKLLKIKILQTPLLDPKIGLYLVYTQWEKLMLRPPKFLRRHTID